MNKDWEEEKAGEAGTDLESSVENEMDETGKSSNIEAQEGAEEKEPEAPNEPEAKKASLEKPEGAEEKGPEKEPEAPNEPEAKKVSLEKLEGAEEKEPEKEPEAPNELEAKKVSLEKLEGAEEKEPENELEEPNKLEAKKVSLKKQTDGEPEGAAPPSGDTTPKPRKHVQRSLILLVLFILLAVAGIVKSGMLKGGSESEKILPIAYIKENAIYLNDLKNGSVLLSENLGKAENFQNRVLAWGAQPSKDGKYFFYQENIKEDGSFDVYRAEVGKEEEGELVAEGVLVYQIDRQGENIAALTADGSLYYNGDLLDSNVMLSADAFGISGDGESVVYVKPEGEQIGFYLGGASEPASIAENVIGFVVAENGEHLLYLVSDADGKTQTLYDNRFTEESEKIADGVVSIRILPESDGIAYLQSGDPLTFADFVEDDCKAEDDAVLAKTEQDFASPEEYQQAKAAAEYRNKVRSFLLDQEIPSLFFSTYLYQDGKSVLVDENVLEAAVTEGDGFYFLSMKQKGEAPKSKLSKLAVGDNPLNLYYDSLLGAGVDLYFGKVGEEGTLIPWEADNDSLSAETAANMRLGDIDFRTFAVSEDGTRFSFTVGSMASETYQAPKSLVYAETENGTVGNVQEIYGVNDLSAFEKGTGDIVVLKETDGALLRIPKGKEAQTVAEEAGMFQYTKDGKTLYYLTDMEYAEMSTGTLWREKNGTATEIDQNIGYFQILEDGGIFYIKDYDIGTQKGDLYYEKDGAVQLLDEGVSSVYFYE